jgi:hypothetical protein
MAGFIRRGGLKRRGTSAGAEGNTHPRRKESIRDETFASFHFEERERREIFMVAVSKRLLPSVEMTKRL